MAAELKVCLNVFAPIAWLVSAAFGLVSVGRGLTAVLQRDVPKTTRPRHAFTRLS